MTRDSDFDIPATPANLAMTASRGLWTPAKHLKVVNREIVTAVTSGDTYFLIVQMPPRHGKSWMISRYFPAWFLGMFPEKRVILVSYSGEFAESWGRSARDVLEEWGQSLFGVSVNPRSSAAARWDLKDHYGGMTAVGMEGTITGRGGNLIVIDDPVKGWLEAQSATYKEKQWEWYIGTLRQRLEPGGVIILLMTRWSEDDLGGRILRHSEENPRADQWHELRLPAIADPDEIELAAFDNPDDWRDMIGRKKGEALWPARYPVPVLEQIRQTSGPYVFDSVYQQRPSAKEGDMFKVANWRSVVAEQLPRELKWMRSWDLASTAKETSGGDPDWTAGGLMAIDPDSGATYIADARWARAESHGIEALLKDTAEQDLKVWGAKKIRIPQDPGSSGKAYSRNLIGRVLKGYQAFATRDEGDKVTRARPFAAQQGAGNVYLLKGSWNTRFIEEFRIFGRSNGHDDMVDACSAGYNELAGLGKRRLRVLV